MDPMTSCISTVVVRFFALSLDVISCFVNFIENPAGTWIFVDCSKCILVEVSFVHLIVEV
jgi:hypothetical protein